MKRSAQKLLILLVKLLITAYTFAYVYYKTFVDYDLDRLTREYSHTVASFNWLFFLTATALLLLNWGIEAVKWRYLMKDTEAVSMKLALKAVFSGTTISLITPNRIGEYAGRVVHLEKSDKIQAAFTTMVGSFSQLCITVVLGCVCFMLQLDQLFPDHNMAGQVVILLCILVVGLSFLLYYNMWVLGAVSRRFPPLQRFNKYLHVFEQYNMRQLTHVLFLSFVRYSVFTLQYVLLLYAFHVDISLGTILLIIPVIFLIQSIVPTFTLAELGVRGYSATFFFSIYSSQHLGILLSAYSLWIINLILPSLMGLFLLLRLRILYNK